MKFFIISLLLVLNVHANADKYLNMLKEFSLQGKNILIEETLLNGINALVDNAKIKINKFDIDDKTNIITIDTYLQGEDENLTIEITKFKWGVTEDKKYIVFEDFDIDMNIEWLQYIVDDIAKRDRGYIKIPHNVAIFSLLYSIKQNTKTTNKYFEKKPFVITEYPFDEKYLKIEQLEISKDMIVTDIWLKGSKENLKIDVESYNIITANGKKTIVQKSEVHIKYTEKLFELLNAK